MMDALDGVLSDVDQQQLAAHLDTCARCQADWEALQAVERVLAHPAMVAPPAGFAERVQARLVRYESQRRRTLLGGLILLGAAAALCLLALPLLLNGRNLLEAYGVFLLNAYDLFSYTLLLVVRIGSALWLAVDAFSARLGIPVLNLLTYAIGTLLAVAALRRSMASPQPPAPMMPGR
jgi:predicted anti-sigma-YlaC factor YlaD